MCIFDWAVSDRLKRRELGIRKHMFVDSSSLVSRVCQNDDDQFWVDGDSLRHFLSCEPGLDKELKSENPIICPASFLCSHGRLSPNTAVRGKLLRKEIYDAYVALLTAERSHLNDIGPGVAVKSVVGTVVKASENLVCDECSKESKAKLMDKLEEIRNFTNLFVALDDEKKESKCVRERECTYLVSKSWASSFKKIFGSLLKSVINFEEGGSVEACCDDSPSLVLAGLADIDLSPFAISIWDNHRDRRIKGKNTASVVFDENVNGKITCKLASRARSDNDFTLNRLAHTYAFRGRRAWKLYPSEQKYCPFCDFRDLVASKKGVSSCDRAQIIEGEPG
jgi:hypothetical protein